MVMLTRAPMLLDGHRHFCTITYSAMTRFLCTYIPLCRSCLVTLVYISALVGTLGTPSEFSSVPILVADELAPLSYLCITILGEYPTTEIPKSRLVALQLRLSDTRDDYA